MDAMTHAPWMLIFKMSVMSVLTLVVLPELLQLAMARFGADALVAYDCASEHAKSFPLDMAQPGSCPDPTLDYAPPAEVDLQVLRVDGPVPVRAGYCRATIKRMVFRCGWRLRSNSMQTSVPTSPVLISEEDCWKLIQTGQFVFEEQDFRLEKGITQSTTYFSHGWAEPGGNCVGVVAIARNGKTFSWHYEESELTIRYDTIPAKLEVNKGVVRFSNGLKVSEEMSSLFDQDKGRTVWQRYRPSHCEDDLSLVFSGKATFHQFTGDASRSKQKRSIPAYENSVAMISGATELQDVHRMGLYYGGNMMRCGHSCHFVANLPKFIVCHHAFGAPQFPNVTFRPEAMTDLQAAQTDSKVLSDLQHLAATFRVEKRFELIIRDQCEAEVRVKKFKLAAVTNGNPYALAHEFGPGHQVIPMQRISYIRRCPSIIVHRAFIPSLNCTKELPVYKGRRTAKPKMDTPPKPDGSVPEAPAKRLFFMNTLSKVLQDYPTVIPCVDEMPALWQDDEEEWHTVHPSQVMRRVPQSLHPETLPYSFDDSFRQELGPNGIFNKIQHEAMMRLQALTQYSDGAVSRVVGNQLEAAENNPDHPGSLTTILSTVDLRQSSISTMRDMTPGITWNIFGTSAGLFYNYLALGSLVCFFGGVAARWLYLWSVQGWDGGRILGRMPLACCGIIDLPRRMARDLFRLGRDGVDMTASSLAPLVELAARWKKKQMEDKEHAADSDSKSGTASPASITKDACTAEILAEAAGRGPALPVRPPPTAGQGAAHPVRLQPARVRFQHDVDNI
jgi:hypothetical protein